MPLSRRQFLSTALPAKRRIAAPPVTPTDRFFRQYTRTPRLNGAFWALSLGGRVRHPLSLSYADLQAMPAAELPCTLVCAANPPGGDRVGHALWRGVPVADVLREVEIAPDARYVRLEGADGHVTGVPLDRLRGGLIAYAMNGDALPPEHGFPARLIVPGLYDHKQPRWIERIDFADTLPTGVWEARGWPADGLVRVTSAITAPQDRAVVRKPVRLRGYAFAGDRAVAAVDVRVDGGPWMPATLGEARPNTWTGWRATWTPPALGAFTVEVRATDETGAAQREADGLHHIVVRAEGRR